MTRTPTYLRAVVTARCSLACSYCHQEGDPAGGAAGGLDTVTLAALLGAGLDNGVRKLKLLGGEPLLRGDLPAIIAGLRARDAALDISLITGGAVAPARLDACFAAGLSRANLSVHGWSQAAFAARTRRGRSAHAKRAAVLARLLAHGRFTKLNYVWRSPADDADLDGLLGWAAGRPVVVNVLDDLGNLALGSADIEAALTRLRGAPARRWAAPDPHSLPTTRLRWADGLEVEVKDQRLGEHAPWRTCAGCPRRAGCREGIFALRLGHDGRLRPCMDRPELGLDLRRVLTTHGPRAASRAWACAVAGWSRGGQRAIASRSPGRASGGTTRVGARASSARRPSWAQRRTGRGASGAGRTTTASTGRSSARAASTTSGATPVPTPPPRPATTTTERAADRRGRQAPALASSAARAR